MEFQQIFWGLFGLNVISNIVLVLNHHASLRQIDRLSRQVQAKSLAEFAYAEKFTQGTPETAKATEPDPYTELWLGPPPAGE